MPTRDLSAILPRADRRTLAAVVTHLSGDPHAVPDLRDRPGIEAKAADVLPPFISGDKAAAPPDDEVLQAAMNLAVGHEIPADYRTLVREQTGIGPIEPRPPLNAPEDFRVLIIGAGITGVLAARQLDELGLHDYVLLERHPEPGGTWWANSYPGCRVDTPSLLYSFTFDQDPGWPEHFSRQPELLRYVKRVADASNLGDRLRCSTSVESMTWDAARACWDVQWRHADGTTGRLTANAVIAALGILRVPKYPDIDGRDTFTKPSMHSAEWNHNVDLSGLRVGVIGTGASSNQIVPAIAPSAAEVVIYQRNAHWIISHPKYGKALEGVERELFELPMYRQWNRFSEFWKFGDGVVPMVRIDPNWPHLDRSISEANDKLRAQLTDYILDKMGDRPDLLDKVIPHFPPYAKRMLIDNGWYDALHRSNVRLVTSPIKRITPSGVETSAGEDELDALVYATGFVADKVLWPIRVTGANGVDVTARMARDPEAYLGISAADAPNLFITPGPNGVIGHGGNGVFFAECHVRYIMECLRALFEENARSMTVRPEALRADVDRVAAEMEHYVQSLPGVDNWYRGERDRVTTLSPKSVLEFWRDCRAPKREDYLFEPARPERLAGQRLG